MKILVINGPNINMLGIRQPEIYGVQTYQDLVNYIESYCNNFDIEVELFQSNHEGTLIDKIQSAYKKVDGIVINAGAYTHTSIAIADALKAVNIKTVEVHISDITKREAYRHINYIREACIDAIIGQGIQGYIVAIQKLLESR